MTSKSDSEWFAERGGAWVTIHDMSQIPPEPPRPARSYVNRPKPHPRRRSSPASGIQRPSTPALQNALSLLKENWERIAGRELANASEPRQFTGQKARRLVVRIDPGINPPWRDSPLRSTDPNHQTFQTTKDAVNATISPLAVDIIDFIIRKQGEESGQQ